MAGDLMCLYKGHEIPLEESKSIQEECLDCKCGVDGLHCCK